MGYVSDDCRICTDFTNTCAGLFESNPTMCSTYADFGNRICPKTCGVCVDDAPVFCNVHPAPHNGTVSSNETRVVQSTVIAYTCRIGFVVSSGDTMRGCMGNGKLSGKPVVCVRTCPNGWTYLLSAGSCAKHFIDDRVTYETARARCFQQVVESKAGVS